MNDEKLRERVVGFRRDLHRIPEIGNLLHKTRTYIVSYLETLDCKITDLGTEGFSAYFECAAGAGAPCVAFRTDMDALPVTEATGLPFASKHEGAMHACGHDGHMSIVLGLAAEVNANMGSLPKNVLLVFQASEETKGGALDLIEAGLFAEHRPERIYGLHLWPGTAKNLVVSRPGGIMAGTCIAVVTVTGRSVHIADFAEGLDALHAAALFLSRAYERGRELRKIAPHLMRFGKLVSGTAGNVVAGSAVIEGTVRSYAEDTSKLVKKELSLIAADIEEETGTSFDLFYEDGYPPVINDPAVYAAAKEKLTAEGFAWHETEDAALYAEDFAFYQKEIPGVYFHLGTGIDTKLHAVNYDIDEDVLLTGVKLFFSLIY